ncbi:MAG: response regulator [Ferruginibacter sp.]
MIRQQHILIVDDDENIVNVLSLILQNAGFQITIDRNGDLFFVNSGSQPELILMDNKLGYKSGMELCRQLKANEQTKRIPVIMISAADNLEGIAREACADYFLAKPFNITDLIDVVHLALHPKTRG